MSSRTGALIALLDAAGVLAKSDAGLGEVLNPAGVLARVTVVFAWAWTLDTQTPLLRKEFLPHLQVVLMPTLSWVSLRKPPLEL